MKNLTESIDMKKNMLLLLMTILFFMATEIQAQEWMGQDPGTYEDGSCYYEDPCCYESSIHVDERDFYAKLLGGANFLQHIAKDGNNSTYNPGYILGGSLGYCWRYGLCLEAEYAYRRNEIKKIHFFGGDDSNHGHFQTSSYMGNLIWKLPLYLWDCEHWDIQPFVGGGIGYDFQQMHSSNSRIRFNQKWHHFSWQVMAGLVYPLFSNAEISLEYKFHQGGCHFYNHSIGVGLIYKFDFSWLDCN